MDALPLHFICKILTFWPPCKADDPVYSSYFIQQILPYSQNRNRTHIGQNTSIFPLFTTRLPLFTLCTHPPSKTEIPSFLFWFSVVNYRKPHRRQEERLWTPIPIKKQCFAGIVAQNWQKTLFFAPNAVRLNSPLLAKATQGDLSPTAPHPTTTAPSTSVDSSPPFGTAMPLDGPL